MRRVRAGALETGPNACGRCGVSSRALRTTATGARRGISPQDNGSPQDSRFGGDLRHNLLRQERSRVL
jgi:hypothetical protein